MGKVKAWLDDRGFGFITDAAGLDVFLHANQLPDIIQRSSHPLLREGQRLTFRRLEDPRGPKAFAVTLCGEPDVISKAEFLAELELAWGLAGVFGVPEPHRASLLAMAREHGWVVS